MLLSDVFYLVLVVAITAITIKSLFFSSNKHTVATNITVSIPWQIIVLEPRVERIDNNVIYYTLQRAQHIHLATNSESKQWYLAVYNNGFTTKEKWREITADRLVQEVSTLAENHANALLSGKQNNKQQNKQIGSGNGKQGKLKPTDVAWCEQQIAADREFDKPFRIHSDYKFIHKGNGKWAVAENS